MMVMFGLGLADMGYDYSVWSMDTWGWVLWVATLI